MPDKVYDMFNISKGMNLKLGTNPYISAIRYIGQAGWVAKAEEIFDLMHTGMFAVVYLCACLRPCACDCAHICVELRAMLPQL